MNISLILTSLYPHFLYLFFVQSDVKSMNFVDDFFCIMYYSGATDVKGTSPLRIKNSGYDEETGEKLDSHDAP